LRIDDYRGGQDHPGVLVLLPGFIGMPPVSASGFSPKRFAMSGLGPEEINAARQEKKKASSKNWLFLEIWCPGEDSNLHTLRH
jgi:hypothetical protein